MKENLCVQNGCQASCCYNILLTIKPHQLNLFGNCPVEKIDPETLQIIMGLSDDSRDRETRLFITPPVETRKGERKLVYVSGPCPNLDKETSSCTIYENRPACCLELAVGSERCSYARQRDGLSPLPSE